jgi:predicted ATPase
LAEAVTQLTRALDQIATLPATPVLRRDQIKFQVALTNALMHTKGYASSETRASLDRAHLYIERAEALGEPPEDPLLLFSALYGFWLANIVAFNGDVVRDLAAEFLALAEKQGTTVPLMLGHRAMGSSLLFVGGLAEALGHLEEAIALYDPQEHRSLATRFGQDTRAVVLTWRALTLWVLGYPEAAFADADYVLKDAREMGQAATLLHALFFASFVPIFCGHYTAADAQLGELAALADEKGSLFWKAHCMSLHGYVLVSTGEPAEAVRVITTGTKAYRSTGAIFLMPFYVCNLATAYAELGQFDDACRCLGEAMTAMETTQERWCEAEIHRIAGEVALTSPERDTARAEACFERALNIARAQQAKSWELRAAMSMARLWCDQGKRDEARELLAPVYGWFTEGFDTLDLKQAKALLDELAA